MADGKFSDFNLVGGTALALKMGHRKSVDIDLFTTRDFDARTILEHVKSNYNAQSTHSIENGVFCFINDVKVDMLSHKYPLVKHVENIEGVRLVSLPDIGAMKLNAIYRDGNRLKDFADIYTLLERFPLMELLAAAERKYPDVNGALLKNSLVY